jgi:hypothetical protein
MAQLLLSFRMSFQSLSLIKGKRDGIRKGKQNVKREA